MRSQSLSVTVPADAATTFSLLHDYEKRLSWDTMLSKATLLDTAKAAGKGVRSLCVGDWKSAWIPMETRYITFTLGEKAAVQLTRKTWFFASFAATIRHDELPGSRSMFTYTYSFRLRPQWLSPTMAPVVNHRLKHEITKRLEALRNHLASSQL